MTFDAELHVLGSFTVGGPDGLAIGHDQRVAPVAARLVEVTAHFLHQEQGADTDPALRCDGKAVLGKDTACGHLAGFLELTV